VELEKHASSFSPTRRAVRAWGVGRGEVSGTATGRAAAVTQACISGATTRNTTTLKVRFRSSHVGAAGPYCANGIGLAGVGAHDGTTWSTPERKMFDRV
jgi:hypothetical protein